MNCTITLQLLENWLSVLKSPLILQNEVDIS